MRFKFFLITLIKGKEIIMKETEERVKECRNAFLWKYGGYTVYFVFLMGLLINGSVAILNFINNRLVFAIWALFSIILLPRATLGFILRLSWMMRNPLVFMNMPTIMWKVFPGTMQKYRNDSLSVFGNPVLSGFIKEIIWLVISIVPIIIFIIQS